MWFWGIVLAGALLPRVWLRKLPRGPRKAKSNARLPWARQSPCVSLLPVLAGVHGGRRPAYTAIRIEKARTVSIKDVRRGRYIIRGDVVDVVEIVGEKRRARVRYRLVVKGRSTGRVAVGALAELGIVNFARWAHRRGVCQQ